MIKHDKKVCLITGATRGLGYELVKKYTSKGFNVIGLATNEARLDAMKTSQLLKEYIVCDLADEESLINAITMIKSLTNSIDVLIHNAAIQQRLSIKELSTYSQHFEKELAINSLAPIKLTEALLPELSITNGEVIVLTSLLKYSPKFSTPAYCASKAALASWVSSIRQDVKDLGISVTEIVPGLIKTDMSKMAMEKGVEPKFLADWMYTVRKGTTNICPGARVGWVLQRLFPGLFKKIMLTM